MNEPTEGNQTVSRDLEFWRAHVMAAQNFIGPDAEYCRRNGLNESTFSTYKGKFGLTNSNKGRPKKFIKIARTSESVSTTATATPTVAIPMGPDAEWMAEFVAALMAARK